MTATTVTAVYPPLAPAQLGARHRPEFPFDQPGCLLTHLGRGAAWLAIRALGLAGKRIAMPAYHCGSEVEAARVAGADIEFYRVRADLSVDTDHLLEVASRCDAVYLISLFGFGTPLAAVTGLGIPVIEDAAHALFSLDETGAPIGSRATAAVFCPRKTLGVPDGGALLTSAPVTDGQAPARLMGRSLAALLAGRMAASRWRAVSAPSARLLAQVSRTERAARAGELTETVIGEWDLTEADFVAAAALPSPVTRWAVTRVSGPEIRRRRRLHYAALAAALSDFVPANFRTLPPGVCPLYLPVQARDQHRDDVLRRLWSGGVRATEIWPVPHPLLDRRRFAELEPARRELLALPVHQAMRDVAAVADRSARALMRR